MNTQELPQAWEDIVSQALVIKGKWQRFQAAGFTALANLELGRYRALCARVGFDPLRGRV